MNRPALFAGIAAALTVLAQPAHAGAPSFSCDSRNTIERDVDAEWAICRSDYLGSLDQALDARYQAVRQQLNARAGAKLRRTQRAWLARRDACRADRRCIARQYRRRLRQLARYEACFDDSARPGCVWRRLERDAARWQESAVRPDRWRDERWREDRWQHRDSLAPAPLRPGRFEHLNGWRL
jgi:uncharacterized protein